MDMDTIAPHFMPIVDLASGDVVGYEALARRIRDGVADPPESWLEDVLLDSDRSRQLAERMLLAAADALRRLPEHIYVAVNFEFGDLRLGRYAAVRRRAGLDALAHRIVIEISERRALTPEAAEAAAFARQLGARIALDDVGAGSARLLALVDLEPALIKLDIGITKRLQEDKIARLVRFVCDGARSIDAKVICEGFETRAAAEAALAAGASGGQGYFSESLSHLEHNGKEREGAPHADFADSDLIEREKGRSSSVCEALGLEPRDVYPAWAKE